MKKRGMGWAVLLICATCFVCFSAGAETRELAAGEPCSVTLAPEETAVFRFVPEDTGLYALRSLAEEETDTFGTLWRVSAEGRELVESCDDDSETGSVLFAIRRGLGKGIEYELECSVNAEGEASFQVLAERIGDYEGLISAMPREDRRTVPYIPGEPAELSVSTLATEGTELTYEWYRVTGEDEDEEQVAYTDVPVLVLEDPVPGTRYLCVVADEEWNELRVSFRIAREGELTVRRVGGARVSVPEGGSVTLEFLAEGAGEEDEILWDLDGEILDGVQDLSYTLEPAEKEDAGVYTCTVKGADGEVSSDFIELEVGGLVMNPGEHELAVLPGETVELTVETAEDNLSCTWFRTDGIQVTELQETEKSLTVDSVMTKEDYYCRVIAPDGREENVFFHLSVRNELTAEPEMNEYAAAPGEQVTLGVITTHRDGDLHFAWYEDGDLIEEEAEPTYTTDPLTESRIYICEVKDDYQNSLRVEIPVAVDSTTE